MADVANNLTGIGSIGAVLSNVYLNFAVAIIILLAGLIIGRLAGRFIHKILEEVELNRLLRKTAGIRFAMDEIIASLIAYFIYFIAIVMALDQIGVATAVLKIISIAIIIIIIASIILGVRDFFPNILAGIFISQKRLISKGDKVRIGEIEGNIIDINMIETRIVTRKGDIIYMPNSLLTKREVIKLKSGGKPPVSK
jgi:small-conductance mechanosensitive channel